MKTLHQIYQLRTKLADRLLISSFLLIALLIVSCTDEQPSTQSSVNHGDIDMLFEVNVAVATPPGKRMKSGQTTPESKINEVQILVFENDAYKYRVKGSYITNAIGGACSFRARIQSSSVATTLYIVANSDAQLSANEPITNETTVSVKSKLNLDITVAGISGNLPMWGSYQLPSGISAEVGSTLMGINMLRAVARIDISKATEVPFQFATIQAFNVGNKIQLIPNNIAASSIVTTPSIPIGATYGLNTNVIETTSGNLSFSQLYLPESEGIASHDQDISATCIVIGGYYNGSLTPSYYRLDFNPGINGHPFGQILRNYRYDFDITRIIEEGYATALDAANNSSTGIGASIVLWQDIIHNTVFNSENYFGIETNTAILDGAINSSLILFTETDVPSFTIRWSDSQGTPLGDPSATSIVNDIFRVNKAGDGSLTITALQANNTDPAERTIRYVLIQANKLQLLLSLIQEPDVFTPGEANWATSNVDQPGTFAPSMKDAGMFYQWNRRVGWAVSGSVVGWNTQGADGNAWEDVTDPCPSGWRVPTHDELKGLLAESPGRRWISIYNGDPASGLWLAPTQPEANAATFAVPGVAIFLPAAGGRNEQGVAYNDISNGYYWAENLDAAALPYALSIVNGTSLVQPVARASGFSIRCVKANTN